MIVVIVTIIIIMMHACFICLSHLFVRLSFTAPLCISLSLHSFFLYFSNPSLTSFLTSLRTYLLTLQDPEYWRFIYSFNDSSVSSYLSSSLIFYLLRSWYLQAIGTMRSDGGWAMAAQHSQSRVQSLRKSYVTSYRLLQFDLATCLHHLY